MKTFNPDKELYKIQYSNRNKIYMGIIMLLLIISIGSTYALYQIRYSKRVVYTKVVKTNKDINIAVYLDKIKTDKFPNKEDGYVYSNIDCENSNLLNTIFDINSWTLKADIKGPDKCNVYFTKSPFYMKSCENKTMADCLLEEGKNFTSYLAYDDPGSNARYIGLNPDNFVYFNCEDYNNPSETTCEKWRIIGSFKNAEKVNDDGTITNENLVKIIRNDVLGGLPFDINNYAESDPPYNNNWTTSELMNLLNPNHQDHLLKLAEDGEPIVGDNSLYWDGKDGNCYTGVCKFSMTGLKNDETRNMIETVKWYLGTPSNPWADGQNGGTAAGYYSGERNSQGKFGVPLTWSGKIALMYPSDYGYATSGGSEFSRQTCINKRMTAWESDCYDNDWLYYRNARSSSPGEQRIAQTLIQDPRYSVSIMFIRGALVSDYASRGYSAHPTLYLKSNTFVFDGSGTYDDPYVIKLK